MAAPPVKLDLQKADYPSSGISDQDSLNKLLTALNLQSEQVVGCLSQGITFSQNMSGQVKTVNVSTPATDWVNVGDSGAPAFQNAWANFNSGWQVASYKKDALGFVHVRGHITAGTLGSAIFTLPVGFRPALNEQFAVMANNVWCLATVDSAGNVSLASTTGSSNSFCTLHGITFQVADFSPGVLSCFPVKVSTTVQNPSGVLVGRILDTAKQAATMAPGGLDFTVLGQGVVQLNNLPGLLLGRSYQVTLLILGG